MSEEQVSQPEASAEAPTGVTQSVVSTQRDDTIAKRKIPVMRKDDGDWFRFSSALLAYLDERNEVDTLLGLESNPDTIVQRKLLNTLVLSVDANSRASNLLRTVGEEIRSHLYSRRANKLDGTTSIIPHPSAKISEYWEKLEELFRGTRGQVLRQRLVEYKKFTVEEDETMIAMTDRYKRLMNVLHGLGHTLDDYSKMVTLAAALPRDD